MTSQVIREGRIGAVLRLRRPRDKCGGRHSSSERESVISRGQLGVSTQTESVVEFFLEHEDAEAMIAEVLEDERELAELLHIEAVQLETSLN
jgi:hypothetical protein